MIKLSQGRTEKLYSAPNAGAARPPAGEPPRVFENAEHEPDLRDWLIAIIDGSDDAIISKDLNGIIRTWNAGATRIFGYSADEVVGRPITILIPEDRLDEEPRILAEIRSGNRVDHFETIRRHKDASFVDLSLTISPIRNARGAIVGASKIARDITERRLAEEKHKLLYGEMQHRVKNLFALAAGLVSLSARSGHDVEAVTRNIHDRLTALYRAHELTMPNWDQDGLTGQTTTLLALIRTILQPYIGQQEISIAGDDPSVGSRAVTHVALLIHEFATNAAKYGCLSQRDGRLKIDVVHAGDEVAFRWKEHCSAATVPPSSQGFGTRLERSVERSLSATIQREWLEGGLIISVKMPIEQIIR